MDDLGPEDWECDVLLEDTYISIEYILSVVQSCYCRGGCIVNRRKSDYISGCFVSVVACFKSVLPVKYGVLGQRMAVSGLPARFRPTGCGTGFRTRPPSDSWGYSTRQLLLTTLLLSLICI